MYDILFLYYFYLIFYLYLVLFNTPIDLIWKNDAIILFATHAIIYPPLAAIVSIDMVKFMFSFSIFLIEWQLIHSLLLYRRYLLILLVLRPYFLFNIITDNMSLNYLCH
jgi:hypothetical protein